MSNAFGHIKHTHTNQKAATDQIGVPQGGVLSPTLGNSYTADLPPPRASVQVMSYNVTLNPGQNNLHSVRYRPCGIYEQSGPQNKTTLPLHMATHPNIMWLTLDLKTHIQHTHTQHLSTRTQASTK